MTKYDAWILANVPQDPNAILSQCREWVDKMHEEFPELTPVPGHVYLTCVMRREHWWLVDEDGNIVDPTAHQFGGSYYSGASIVSYDPWEGPLPTGKCPNCGDYCYNGDGVCSEECHREYVSYIESECRR